MRRIERKRTHQTAAVFCALTASPAPAGPVFSGRRDFGTGPGGAVPAETGGGAEQVPGGLRRPERETDGPPPRALSAVVIYFRYPLLAFLLGFASIGVVLLPCVTVAYGFFLSFSVCCFTAAFGAGGVLLALAVFGLRCVVTLPCYFLLAVPSWGTSACRPGRLVWEGTALRSGHIRPGLVAAVGPQRGGIAGRRVRGSAAVSGSAGDDTGADPHLKEEGGASWLPMILRSTAPI